MIILLQMRSAVQYGPLVGTSEKLNQGISLALKMFKYCITVLYIFIHTVGY